MTVAPTTAVPVKVGVVALVMLSVSSKPVSDAAARSGAEGAAGAILSTKNVLSFVPVGVVLDRALPARSLGADATNDMDVIPSSQPDGTK